MGPGSKRGAGQSVGVGAIGVERTGGVDDDVVAVEGREILVAVKVQGGGTQFGSERLCGGKAAGGDGQLMAVPREEPGEAHPENAGTAKDQDLHLSMRRCNAGSGRAQRSPRPNSA